LAPHALNIFHLSWSGRCPVADLGDSGDWAYGFFLVDNSFSCNRLRPKSDPIYAHDGNLAAWPDAIGVDLGQSIPAQAGNTGSRALPAAILLIPPQLAKSQLKNAIRNTPQHDAILLDITPIKGVEIQRGVRPSRDLYQGRIFSRRLCGELCEQLLFGGDVDWVRVRLSNDTFNNK